MNLNLKSEWIEKFNEESAIYAKVWSNNIIHHSISLSSLQELSKNLVKNKFPLVIWFSNVANYFNLIELIASQKDSKLIFINYINWVWKFYSLKILNKQVNII